MPTYEYRCAKCGNQFEARQSIHDDALTVHDGDCAGTLTKVLSVGGIVLKGPGFYRTDSRNKPAARDRKSEGDSSKSDTSSSNGSGDSKKSDSGSKSETTTSGASKSDSSKS
ncbi:MAG: FmdB family zinc ribbon protein [Acidimicrobiia bacterium]